MKNLKFPFLQSLFSLIFVWCFYAILLFFIIDCSGIDEKVTAFKFSIFNFGFDYWAVLATLVCSGLATIFPMFFKNDWNQQEETLSLILTKLFLVFIILFMGGRLLMYFNFENTKIDAWLYALDVLAVLLYFTFAYISDKWQNTGDNKFRYATIGILTICSVCAFVISNHYMPLGIMRDLNKDYQMVIKVDEIESKLANKEEVENLPEGISIREEKGKKIISWNMVVDYENLNKKIRITKRLKFKFGGDRLIPGINPKHKKGINERVINYFPK